MRSLPPPRRPLPPTRRARARPAARLAGLRPRGRSGAGGIRRGGRAPRTSATRSLRTATATSRGASTRRERRRRARRRRPAGARRSQGARRRPAATPAADDRAQPARRRRHAAPARLHAGAGHRERRRAARAPRCRRRRAQRRHRRRRRPAAEALRRRLHRRVDPAGRRPAGRLPLRPRAGDARRCCDASCRRCAPDAVLLALDGAGRRAGQALPRAASAPTRAARSTTGRRPSRCATSTRSASSRFRGSPIRPAAAFGQRAAPRLRQRRRSIGSTRSASTRSASRRPSATARPRRWSSTARPGTWRSTGRATSCAKAWLLQFRDGAVVAAGRR